MGCLCSKKQKPGDQGGANGEGASMGPSMMGGASTAPAMAPPNDSEG